MCDHIRNVRKTANARKRINPLLADPTRSIDLRRRLAQHLRQKYKRLKASIRHLLVVEDAFGLKGPTRNVQFKFQTSNEQVASFQKWLTEEMDETVLEGLSLEDADRASWKNFSEEGYRKGQGRAFDDTRAARDWKGNTGDFYKGTRDEFLRGSFGRPVRTAKLKLLAGRVFTDLKGVNSQMAAGLNRTLTDGLARGEGPAAIAKKLSEVVDNIGQRRATLIARTEITRAHAEGQLDSFESLGVTEVGVMVEWSTAGDDRVCQLCLPMEGTVMTIKEARGLIPRHVQCVTGDSIIVADDVKTILKSHYTGEVVELVTSEGRRLAVTANHILFTKFGFVPARFAYKGLEVLSSPYDNINSIETPNDNSGKACISDVFASFAEDSLMISERVKLSPENLHGDGKTCNSEVHIVRPDSKLWNQWGINFFTEQEESQLQSFKLIGPKVGLSSVSPYTQFLERTARAFDSSVGSLRELLALLLGHLLHSQEHGLAPIAGLNSGIVQSFIDCATRTPELFRQSLNTHPLLKKLNNLSSGDIKAIAFGRSSDILASLQIDSSLFESPTNSIVTNTKIGSNVNGTHTTTVSLDQIISVNVKHVTNLPVYDVQTLSTVYRVNGILTSNCRCAYIPANVGENTKGQKRTSPELKSARRQSIKAEIPKSSDRTIAQQSRRSKWPGATRSFSTKRPKSVLTEPKPIAVRKAADAAKRATEATAAAEDALEKAAAARAAAKAKATKAAAKSEATRKRINPNVADFRDDLKNLKKSSDELSPNNLLGEKGLNRFIVGTEKTADGTRRIVVFDVIADKKGAGAFTKSVTQLKKSKVPIRMDNVQTERFKEGLERLGFKRHGKSGMIWEPVSTVKATPKVITPKVVKTTKVVKPKVTTPTVVTPKVPTVTKVTKPTPALTPKPKAVKKKPLTAAEKGESAADIKKEIARRATEGEIDVKHLKEAYTDLLDEKFARVREVQAAKTTIHVRTHLPPDTIKKLENAGFDYTAKPERLIKEFGDTKATDTTIKSLAQFDERATSLARENPILELGNPDDPAADLSASLWEALRNPKQRLPSKLDEELLDEATELVQRSTIASEDVQDFVDDF